MCYARAIRVLTLALLFSALNHVVRLACPAYLHIFSNAEHSFKLLVNVDVKSKKWHLIKNASKTKYAKELKFYLERHKSDRRNILDRIRVRTQSMLLVTPIEK